MEAVSTPSSQPRQPLQAASSAILPAGLLNPAFEEWVLSWKQTFASDFLQHWKSVGKTSWCNLDISGGLNDRSLQVCMDSPRAALAIAHLLLSTSEASWHSPVWINAFLFISLHVPQRQN